MENLLLHPRTQANLQAYIQQPAHALVLIGPLGAGKTHLAQKLVQQLITAPLNSANWLHIQPVQGTIAVDEIRRLHGFVRLKTTGQGTIRRAILVEDAQSLGVEAQNAFLKLLEEPPADTICLLTVTHAQALLPTIFSRTQAITVLSPALADCQTYFQAQGFTPAAINKAYHMANGQIGLLANLLQAGPEHPLVAAITQAKQLLQASVFERLAQVDSLGKQKQSLGELLWALQLVCHAALQQATQKGQTKQMERWLGSLSRLLEAQKSLAFSPQSKLLLTHLLINL